MRQQKMSLQRSLNPGHSLKGAVTPGRIGQSTKTSGVLHLGLASSEKPRAAAKKPSDCKAVCSRKPLTAGDLEKLLCSTGVAKILLDTDLNIRFFTPASTLLFEVGSEDIGRPLSGVRLLAPDEALLQDAEKVLHGVEAIEREIESEGGAWYVRRILPYRTEGKKIEGLVITFADITHQKETAAAMEHARLQADSANIAKSRFLAAASHDLRQPLQTLVLLQELLAKAVEGEKAQKLVARVDQTLGGMAGMLNALLDINQIEAGTIRPKVETFPVRAVLDRVTTELAYQAEAQRIVLRVLPCSLSVSSDPRLLEQMVRNLLSNALKYTKRGKVLLGCRRRKGIVSIQIWDTGVGIPAGQQQDIFEEYHQLDNAARDRNLGLGLGLSIVKRLGILLDHPVAVRSQLGKGSVFSIDVERMPGKAQVRVEDHVLQIRTEQRSVVQAATILVVEDDAEVRGLLEIGLGAEGYRVRVAADGVSALKLLRAQALQPDLVISDFNLPNGMDGICVATELRSRLQRSVPVVILTGDISTKTLREIAIQKCEHLNKPASLKELLAVTARLIPRLSSLCLPMSPSDVSTEVAPVVYVVDDDSAVRHAIRCLLEDNSRVVEDHVDAESFLKAYRPGGSACLLIDANLPGMSGLGLLKRLKEAGHSIPAIMITGNCDVPMAVEAMKAGASDFLEKPIRGAELLKGVGRALETSHDSRKLAEWCKDAADHLAGLTRRQHQIMEMVLAGNPSKNIAADLGISQRTVENHRASIMRKAGVRSLPALARLAVAAAEATMSGQSLRRMSGAFSA
jgi:two-component system CheB/CheR fusion protein